MLINTPLLTDQYELVMAQGYWLSGMAEKKAVFHLFFRSHPFDGKYTISAGLNRVIEFISNWRFSKEDIAYLATLKNPKQNPLFSPDFLTYLKNTAFSCSLDAIPEGTIVFPHEPLIRIEGPLLQCQILETALINLVQFPTLIATRASRLYHATKKGSIVEFGLRRAQGPDGGLTASRAAYLGGCKGTSNVLAGQIYDIPVFGTQAHSWIMVFPDELTAFEKFAQINPENLILLVDTYHTKRGVENAIKVAKQLDNPDDLLAVRLDSGDLLALSKQTRQQLDDAGLNKTKIMVSGDLSEPVIHSLLKQGAPIDLWGIGTKLVTSSDDPYLNVAYKLAAIENEDGAWDYKLKISNTPEKSTRPGVHQVRRYYQNGGYKADLIYDLHAGIQTEQTHVDHYEDLLVPVFKSGKLVYAQPNLHDIRKKCLANVEAFLNSERDDYEATLDNYILSLKKTLREQL